MIYNKNESKLPGLKEYVAQENLRKAAEIRFTLVKGVSKDITKYILSSSAKDPITTYYHSDCKKRYTAAKAP